VLLSDTVGFIRDLPHDLVAAFKSTLAETRDADLLLHVVDAADAERDQHIAEVHEVLAEIGAQDVPQVLVFNKIDKLLDGSGSAASAENGTSAGNGSGKSISPRVDSIDAGRVPRVWLSARSGEGLDLLRGEIARSLQHERVHCWLHVPDASGRLRARLFEQGLVASERPAESGWELEIDAPRYLIEPLFGLPGGDGDWLKAQVGENSSLAT